MKKRMISMLLVLALVLGLCPAVMAANTDTPASLSYVTSKTGRIEIVFEKANETREANITNKIGFIENGGDVFEVRQYESGELIQTVMGRPGGDKLFVTDYSEGQIITEEIVLVADIIIAHSSPARVEKTAADYGTYIGTIRYNKDFDSGREEVIAVYSKMTSHDLESFTINAGAKDTLALIVGAVVGILAVFISHGLAASISQDIVIAVVSNFGGSVLGGAIGVNLSEEVAVDAYYYNLTGYHALTGRYSSARNGIARLVRTKNSSYYNKWFYEGYTPQTWKDGDDLAISLWNEMIGRMWPYVKSYT